MTRKQIFSWFFIGIFLLLIYLFYQILKPFILSIFWSAILVLALHSLHERLTKFLKNKAGISSLIMTILAIFVIVIPLGLIITTLATETVILDVANKERMDLIILETDIRAGSDRLFLGLRVERMLENAPCPVIMINS